MMPAPILTETDETIYELLDAIQRRPALTIAQPELVRVYAFLIGYECALGHQRLIFRHVEPDFHRFHDWIAQRLDYGESTSGWHNMIRGRCSNEREAFDKFYELLAEFRANAGGTAA